MWGGRFDRPPDAAFDAFQRSFDFDRRLLPYELAVDRAWARAIAAADLISAEQCERLVAALDQIEKRAGEDPAWLAQSPAEDVHHFVEQELIALLGPLGARLHTGRSRNELVVADFRLFVMDAAREMRGAVAELIAALLGQAERNLLVPMPGNTHLQRAQPLLFSHYALAHVEALFRDAERLAAARNRADACPLGSGALAGCAFPVDRVALARELGFSRPTANSLDATSDRDFAVEYLLALALVGTHLSRLAEDMVLFASQEFSFVILPDEYSTGSSLMPQKKNPDAWELLRGKSGRLYGSLVALLVTLKGVATGYQRDLQEDKEGVFAAHDQALQMTCVAAGAFAALRLNEQRMREAASDPALLATEAADFLVRRGMPFREAHEVVARICHDAERVGMPWLAFPLAKLRTYSEHFTEELHAAITLEAALARRSVTGGTAPDAVRTAMADCRARLVKLRETL
jgi:argininosuccinate lyase